MRCCCSIVGSIKDGMHNYRDYYTKEKEKILQRYEQYLWITQTSNHLYSIRIH